jgi:hypothetical protein
MVRGSHHGLGERFLADWADTTTTTIGGISLA